MAFPPLTQDDLLALWRTLFPSGYTQPIETQAGGQGLDQAAMQAAIFARVAEAANVTFGALYLRPHSTQTAPPAAGAQHATVTLDIVRAAPATGEITLVAGVAFVATIRTPSGRSLDGVTFEVLADTVIPAGSLTTQVEVRASRVGFSSNVPAGSVSRFVQRGTASVVTATIEADNVLRDAAGASGGDRLTPAMTGQYVRLVGGLNGGTVPRRIISVTASTITEPTATAVLDGAPLTFPDTLSRAEVLEFADLGLSVSQTVAATGGVDGWLDYIGEERNTPRQRGEGDDAYRLRLSSLADVVSPGAILRAASRILSPLGIAWALEETRDPSGLRGMVLDFDAFDTGSIEDGAVMLSLDDCVRFFVLRIGIGNQGEFGMPFDAPYPSNAFDAPGNALNFFDGFPVTYLAAVAALWATVEASRAAGIHWLLVRDPSL